MNMTVHNRCLLYTSDAADDLLCVDLGGRRIIKTTKDCINIGDTVSANIANGLTDNIWFFFRF